MKCEDVQRLLSGYIDNELSPEESEFVKAHLSKCPTCQTAWHELNSLVQATRCLPELEPPSDLLQRVKQGLSPCSKRGRLLGEIACPLSLKVPVWSFAAVAIFVGIFLVVASPYQRDAVKTMKREISFSSTQIDKAKGTAGNETVSVEAPSLDVITQEQVPPAKEGTEVRSTMWQPQWGQHSTTGESTQVPSTEPHGQASILSFRSISGMEWTHTTITGPAMTRKLLKVVEPEYPDWVKQRELEGTVELMCLVSPSGQIARTLTWLTSGWSDLDQSVLQAIGEWRFEPIAGEELQASIVKLTFDFSGE